MTIVSDQVYGRLIRQVISSNCPGLTYSIVYTEKGQIPMSQQLGNYYDRAEKSLSVRPEEWSKQLPAMLLAVSVGIVIC